MMTVVTGVSGSGKSSLICEVLYNALLKVYKESSGQIVQYKKVIVIGGDKMTSITNYKDMANLAVTNSRSASVISTLFPVMLF